MNSKPSVAVFWFRRDLRLDDNGGLFHALKSGYTVVPIFIFDTDILSRLEDPADRRVDMIHQILEGIHAQLKQFGSGLRVLKGAPIDAFRHLQKEYNIDAVFCNTDYEPYAIQRDQSVQEWCAANHARFQSFKDQVVFDYSEVLKDDGTPYTIYTPYSKRWLAKLNDFYVKPYPVEHYYKAFLTYEAAEMPTLATIGFRKTDYSFAAPQYPDTIIDCYDQTRDFPAISGTSMLAPHLRFGTISVRKLADYAKRHNLTFLKELIWREFFMQILAHFPHVVTGAFKPAYNRIQWRNDESDFARWCEGKTGYPIVDAGMRELNATGHMHNRVRMVVASFLTKHLLISWQWGEAYFAKKLMDFDLSANNGNWQWAAGCGCDAAPYFRVFNPTEQTRKFDPELKYIRKWVPELDSFAYPKPIVEHSFARDRALKVYKEALQP
jgi:deoxyribodipyrimidine photo-lyase